MNLTLTPVTLGREGGGMARLALVKARVAVHGRRTRWRHVCLDETPWFRWVSLSARELMF